MIDVVNRSPERGAELAERVDGTAVPFDRLVDVLGRADVGRRLVHTYGMNLVRGRIFHIQLRQALAAKAAHVMQDFTRTANNTTWDAWYWRAWRASAPVAVSAFGRSWK